MVAVRSPSDFDHLMQRAVGGSRGSDLTIGFSGMLHLTGHKIGMCEALGVVEHGDHYRRHAEYAEVRCGRHWQWQGILLRILPHQQTQGLLPSIGSATTCACAAIDSPVIFITWDVS